MAAVKKTTKVNGYGEKQTVRVITVDKERRRVECAMRDGAMIWAAVWETGIVFRWPEVGEIWTVRQDTGVWRLDQIVQSELAEDESTATPKALKELPEGSTRIIGDTVYVQKLIQLEGTELNEDKNFVFDQATPLSTWKITHNLEKHPAIQVFDTSNRQVEGEVIPVSDSEIEIIFSAPFSGKAYLN